MDSGANDQEAGRKLDSDEDEDQGDILNASMESEHLDPEEKAAHEADTLPMDAEQPKKEDLRVLETGSKSRAQKVRQVFDPILVKGHPLPVDPTRRDRFIHAVRCPPHGILSRTLTLATLPVLLWMSCLSMFGSVASPPDGPIFLLILLVVTGMMLGKVLQLVRVPPLLGMLIMGIILKNLPFLHFDEVIWPKWSSTLRGIALVIILMRAGLGLDPEALKKLSGMVFRLAFTPCLVETLVVAIASHLLLGFPWLWGFMLGFILAAVSPAVVVPCLLHLQEQGYGVAKGIPTLVIAAASVDDVLAISGFTILLGITFKTDANLVRLIFQGPLEALIGLLFGVAWGCLVIFLPTKDNSHFKLFQFTFLFAGGLLALFGSKRVDVAGAGALAVLVMAFVAGVGWRRQGLSAEDDHVSKTFSQLWIIFQPILFGLIGTEIQINRLDPATVGWGILVLFIGLVIRVIVSFFAVMGGNLTLKERLFVALAWLPKATVQAAIGPVAYDNALDMKIPRDDYKELGLQVLTIAVLVILITAPIGAVAIMVSAPKLLSKETVEQDLEKSQ